MFKPLLRTLPTLSGNVKLNCKLSNYKKIDDNTVECVVKTAQLLPLTHKLYKKYIGINLLNGSYEYDISNFYKVYSKYFYNSEFDYNKTKLNKLNIYDEIVTRNLDFEFGCKRISYLENGNQFTFFAPIYCESVDDIPDYFMIKVSLTNAYYTADKYIKVKIGEISKYNQLRTYLHTYLNKIDNNVIYCLPNSNEANYKGISLEHGGFTEAIDNKFGSLYNNHNTINNFDAIICNGFKRNKIIIRQILPLAFSFNVNDILHELNNTQDDVFKFAKMNISGSYYKDGEQVLLNDFNIDYTQFNEDILQLNENNGLMEYIKGNASNIMDLPFPALNESRYINYQYSNKLTANYCRWKLKYSTDEHPYITNMNVAFSMNRGSYCRYNTFPIKFSPLTALLNVLKYDEINRYNLIYPLGTTRNFYYKNNYKAIIKRYNSVFNNYCLNWYNVCDSSNNIFEDYEWYNIEDDKVFCKGILYDFKNIYNNYKTNEIPKIEKFNVFINVSSSFKTTEEIDDNLVFTNYSIITEGNQNNNLLNCKVNNKILYNTYTNIFSDEYNSIKYTDSFKINQIFTYHTPTLTTYTYSYDYIENNLYSYTYNYSYDYYDSGNFINLLDYDIDFYEYNKYYNYNEILELVNNVKLKTDIQDLFNNYSYTYTLDGYIQLPIYNIESIMDKDSIILDKYAYSLTQYSIIDKLYTVSKSSPKVKLLAYDNYTKKFSNIDTKYKNDLYFTTLYSKTKLISKQDLHKNSVNFSEYFNLDEIVKANENKLTKYLYLPTGSHNNIVYAIDIFKEINSANKFYGDVIPNSEVRNDNDVLYVDPYNLHNILAYTNEKISNINTYISNAIPKNLFVNLNILQNICNLYNNSCIKKLNKLHESINDIIDNNQEIFANNTTSYASNSNISKDIIDKYVNILHNTYNYYKDNIHKDILSNSSFNVTYESNIKINEYNSVYTYFNSNTIINSIINGYSFSFNSYYVNSIYNLSADIKLELTENCNSLYSLSNIIIDYHNKLLDKYSYTYAYYDIINSEVHRNVMLLSRYNVSISKFNEYVSYLHNITKENILSEIINKLDNTNIGINAIITPSTNNILAYNTSYANILKNISEYKNTIKENYTYISNYLEDYHPTLLSSNIDIYNYNKNIINNYSYAYNYNEYVTTYNSKCISKYRLAYLDYPNEILKEYPNYFTYYNISEEDEYTNNISKELYAKFFNLNHLNYYCDILYKNYNMSNSLDNPLYNIFIRTKCLSNTNKVLKVNDLYHRIYLPDYLPENKYDMEYSNFDTEYLDNEVGINIDDTENIVTNEFVIDKKYPSISKISIVSGLQDLYENIKYNKDIDMFYFNDEDRFNKYGYFELYFKKTFFKIDKQLWELINIEGHYKDLYLYLPYEQYEYDKNKYNHIDFMFELPKTADYEIVNTDNVVKPMFNNLFLQQKENTKVFAEYILDNIKPIHTKDNKYTFYRYNKNNALAMFAINSIKNLELDYNYVFDKTYDLYNPLSTTVYKSDNCYDNLNIYYNAIPEYTYNYSYSYVTNYSKITAYVISYSYNLSNTFITEAAGKTKVLTENESYTYSYNTGNCISTYYYCHLNTETYPEISYYDTCKYTNYDIIPIYGYSYSGAYTTKEVSLTKNLIGYSYSYYGYYMFNINIDNTSNTFNMVDENANSIKAVHFINGNYILDSTFNLSSIFNFVVPFSNVNIYNLLGNMSAVYVPKKYSIKSVYLQNHLSNGVYNIMYKNNLCHYNDLYRYFDNIVPIITPVQFINNSHNLKYKSIDKTVLETGKYTELGDSAIEKHNINIFEYYPVYNIVEKPSNKFDEIIYEYITPFEYKHFNDNKFYNLEEKIKIKVDKKLYYKELLELETDKNTYLAFKNYLKINSRNNIPDDEVLFLYKKYKVEYDSVSIGLNTNLTEKVYSLTYKFSLL